MSTTIDDGGPAFGHAASYYGECPHKHHGMTLRDYFAAHAAEQIVNDTEPQWIQKRTGLVPPADLTDHAEWGRFWARGEALLRYQYADAMIAARKAQAPQ